MDKTAEFVKWARLLAPIVVLLIGLLLIANMFVVMADLSLETNQAVLFGLQNGCSIIVTALTLGLLVMGAAEILFCVLSLTSQDMGQMKTLGALLSGEPIGFLWGKLDRWLKLTGIIWAGIGLVLVVNVIRSIPFQQAPFMAYAQIIAGMLRSVLNALVRGAMLIGFGDIVFRLRRAVYRQTQPAE